MNHFGRGILIFHVAWWDLIFASLQNCRALLNRFYQVIGLLVRDTRDLFYGRCQSARADRFLLLSVRNSRRRQDATESHTFYMLNTLNLFLLSVFCLASKIPFPYFKLWNPCVCVCVNELRNSFLFFRADRIGINGLRSVMSADNTKWSDYIGRKWLTFPDSFNSLSGIISRSHVER